MTTPANGRLAILVGGGPAPGINSVISSVTIEAINEGLEVLGIFDGFQHLIAGTMEEPGQASDLLDGMRVCTLSIPDVSSIHFQGGSVLRTSRANPTQRPGDLETVIASLDKLGVNYRLGPDKIGDKMGDIVMDYKISGFPTTVLIDRDGNIHRRWSGALDLEKLEELVREIM